MAATNPELPVNAVAVGVRLCDLDITELALFSFLNNPVEPFDPASALKNAGNLLLVPDAPDAPRVVTYAEMC